MSCPKHHDFEIDARLFHPSDESVAKFVGMMIREEALECRVDSIQVRVTRLVKVYIRQNSLEHRHERNRPLYLVSTEFRLARHARQCFALDPNALKLGATQTEVQQYK